MVSSKVVLAGNNLAAVYTLELLLQALRPGAILAIAPDPNRPAPWHVSLQRAAGEAGVQCLTPTDVNDPEVLVRVRDHRPELLLSVYYTQIFREGMVEAIAGPALNFHPSLLPRHRGTAPLIWAIIEGDSVTGITVHHIDEGVDTGNIVIQHPLPIHPADTGYHLHLKTAKLVRSVAADLIRMWAAGEDIPAGRQQTGEATYHSSRDPNVNHIDWSLDRARIRNIVRAIAPPLPGAFTLIDGEPLVLARVEPIERSGSKRKPPGMVELVRGQPPIVWAGDGAMELTTFIDDGVARTGEDLAHSRGIVEGQILG
jgi:methionyl-tRNA formyltransferase